MQNIGMHLEIDDCSYSRPCQGIMSNKRSNYQTICCRQNLTNYSKRFAIENKTNEHNGIWTSKEGKSFAKIKQQ